MFLYGSYYCETRKSAGKIPGSTLKIIAMVCMLIDHTAAVLFDRIPDFPWSSGCGERASDGGASFLSTGNTAVIYYADMIMRAIGRISFPIFCFLLIEGFMHTHDVKKYALNLGIFALVSGDPVRSGICGKTVLSGLSECLFHFIYRPCDDDFFCRKSIQKRKKMPVHGRGRTGRFRLASCW